MRIARDRLGVPRIEARSRVDLAFGHGFCLGQDRLWQMELYRRYAAGRISEFAGPEGLKGDVLMRTLGLKRVADREAATLDERRRTYLEAYAAGVDAAVAAARALPLELQLLGIEPEPWSPADSLAVGKIIGLGFSTNMETELFRAELIRKIGVERAAKLEPAYPEGNPMVMGGAWSGPGLELAGQLAEVRGALGIGLQPAGSNNWAVSGSRSVTGAPLLAGDPHITTSMPDVWYQVELSAPGTELRGASMPTFPGLMIGQTPNFAWSFTNTMADVQDLFVERIENESYLFEGERRPLTLHAEEIRVRGRKQPELVEVRETHHGPLVTDIIGAESDEPLALAWTGLREPFITALSLDVGDARDGVEATEMFSDYAVPVMNMVWADSSGNIGFKLVGKLPRRRGKCPDVPKPGWTGEHEWEGYVPWAELPAIVNPESGVLVTANNKIAPDDFPHHITSEYLDGFRAARIEQLLAERERHSLDDFERIQCDLYSIPGAETARRLCALAPRNARQRKALELLQRLGPPARPRQRGGLCLQALHRALRAAGVGAGDRRPRLRGALALEVPARLHRDDIVAVALPRPPARPLGGGRRRAGGRARLGRARHGGPRRGAGRAAQAPQAGLGRRARPALPARAGRGQHAGVEAARPLALAHGPRRRRPGDRLPDRLRAARGRLHRRLGAFLPAARRPRRAAALPLAAHDRPVGPSRLGALRRPARGLARRRHQPRAPAARRDPAAGARLMASRRDQIKMDDEELRAFLDEQLVMQVATVGPRGRPHVTPLWFVVDDGMLKGWTYAKSQKAKNLERDPRATVAIEDGVEYDKLRGVMIECDVELERETEQVAGFGEALVDRYGGGAEEMKRVLPRAGAQARGTDLQAHAGRELGPS